MQYRTFDEVQVILQGYVKNGFPPVLEHIFVGSSVMMEEAESAIPHYTINTFLNLVDMVDRKDQVTGKEVLMLATFMAGLLACYLAKNNQQLADIVEQHKNTTH
jgi:hypothetical protein